MVSQTQYILYIFMFTNLFSFRISGKTIFETNNYLLKFSGQLYISPKKIRQIDGVQDKYEISLRCFMKFVCIYKVKKPKSSFDSPCSTLG